MTSSSAAAVTANQSTVSRTEQGLFCVWHGLNRQRWNELKRVAGPARGYHLRRASLAVVAALNSLYESVENAFYGARVRGTVIEHAPVFVLGHWRSGTTLLHNLLTLDPQFTFPNLYQTLFPGHFLLTESVLAPLTGWALPKTRPMDNVEAGWAMPQEDEVALLLRTLQSPYMMLLRQGDRPFYEAMFELSGLPPHLIELWKREFLQFLRKLTIRSNRPIVLKSPTHTYRIPLLLELFPNAKFVYIRRDPYAVYSSSVHLRRAIFVDNALSTPNYEGLEEDTIATYAHCIHRYEATKSLIPEGQLHELRFEDLETDLLGEMKHLYDHLGFSGWDTVEPAIRKQIPQHQRYRKNKFHLDPATMREVHSRLEFAFELYGYPSHLADVESPEPRQALAS